MSLSSLNLKSVYRSGRDDLIREFYIPCLKQSIRYDRAVGYFSASMLSLAAQGLSALFEKQGNMRLVIGAALTEDEARAVLRGYADRVEKEASARLQEELQRFLRDISDSVFEYRLRTLSNLIAAGRLDIKVALTRKGMYHEKLGAFYDDVGNSIVFSGSANESQAALSFDFNFESISVYPSWIEAVSSYHDEYKTGFEKLWSNREDRALVIDFPVAAKEAFLKFAASRRGVVTSEIELQIWDELARKYKRDNDDRSSANPNVPIIYKGEAFSIRAHQQTALQKWQAAEYLGTLALATGSGKTITAIYAATKLYMAKKRLAFVVAVPYQSLADQWVDEMSGFGWRAVPCFGGWQNWQNSANDLATAFSSGGISALALVVVNATLMSERFQTILNRLPMADTMWVGDECHHHGGENLARYIPKAARYRLGLSATPMDYVSQSRNDRVLECYGPVISSYSLRDALNDGVLTPYDYHVHVVELTEKESVEYNEITGRIRNLMLSKSKMDESPALTAALMKRARLLGSAENKLKLLEELLSNTSVEPMTLLYCGDGSVEGDEEDETDSVRQIDAVSSIMSEHGWKTSHFTAREGRKERQGILDNFRHGVIDGLVAIHCLDEGVDVPACRSAYILASSRNPRQFIQRRGRILRRSPGKEFASIHDFLVRIPKSLSDSFSTERNLVSAELRRVAEFASSARNFPEIYQDVQFLLSEYDLLHELVVGTLQHQTPDASKSLRVDPDRM